MSERPKYNPQIHHRRSIRLKGYDYTQAGAYFITLCTHNRQPFFGSIEPVGAGFTPALDGSEANGFGIGASPTPTEMPTGQNEENGFTPALDGSEANGFGIGASLTPTEIPTGQNEENGFTPIEDAQMNLNAFGQIAYEQWQKIPERFHNVELAEFVIMPNHIHGILIIHEPVGADGVGAGFTPALDSADAGPGVGASPTPTVTTRAAVGDIIGAYKSIVANECLKIFKSHNETMGKLWQRNYYEHIIRDETAYRKIAEYIRNNPARWEMDQLFVGKSA